jgi:hypothetical protein
MMDDGVFALRFAMAQWAINGLYFGFCMLLLLKNLFP